MGAFISSEPPAEKKAGPGLKGNVKKNNYPKNVYLNSTLGFEKENTPLENTPQAYNVDNNGKMKKIKKKINAI